MLKQLNIVPEPSMILMCDFLGYQKPEIVKRRHVIVISPKSRNSWGTSIVVPISSVVPRPATDVHVELDPKPYGCFNPAKPQWVKANLIAHVRTERLDRVKANGLWCTPKLTSDDYRRVIRAAAHALAPDI